MKIRITTDRKPWLNGTPLDVGTEVNVTEAEGKAFIDLGFAEEIKPVAKLKAKTNV
jgi:hypothetical protein